MFTAPIHRFVPGCVNIQCYREQVLVRVSLSYVNEDNSTNNADDYALSIILQTLNTREDPMGL